MSVRARQQSRPGLGDELLFLREWAGNPLKTGAVSPSGRSLARAMAACVRPERPGRIVEIGPGTGVVTRALIERGIAPERLLLVEYNRDFCRLLRQRYKGVEVVAGDAYKIDEILAGEGVSEPASIVTGLPLLTRPLAARLDFLDKCLSLGAPGMPLIQFSYALQPPIPPGLGDYGVVRARRIWWNLPPATVWVYSRGA